jgi:hypothetical protein
MDKIDYNVFINGSKVILKSYHDLIAVLKKDAKETDAEIKTAQDLADRVGEGYDIVPNDETKPFTFRYGKGTMISIPLPVSAIAKVVPAAAK